MTQRIGWDAQPGEAEAEAADRRRTKAEIRAVPIGQAPVVEVLQAAHHGRNIVPVRLVGGARVTVLPLRVSAMFSVLLGAPPTPARKIIGADPKRALLVIGKTSQLGVTNSIVIGRSQTEANDASAFRLETITGPYIFHFTEELWARTADDADGPVRISVATEEWTR